MADSLLRQVFELWVEPEFEKRGLPFDRAAIRHVLVVMSPGRRAQNLINDEAKLVADVRAVRSVDEGEADSSADFDEVLGLRPSVETTHHLPLSPNP
ncbi:MAG: hypothetical protein GY701_00685 [Sulfitobacter sp.]|nr:hypothetical protein [Sulfitobacter sp.]